MIKTEMERFEKCRIKDFKIMFIKYLENHLDHQAQVRQCNILKTYFQLKKKLLQLVKYWEAFLPEAKSIA